MGYTHHWKFTDTLTEDEWSRVVEISKKCIELSAVPVAYEYDQPGRPARCDETEIHFNGIREDGCETFYIPAPLSWNAHHRGGGYCKTWRRPYDHIVVAILLTIQEVAPDKFNWGSDGGGLEHLAGRDLCKQSMTGEEDPKVAELRAKTESFPDWSEAFDTCRERDKPMLARVGTEVCKIFPSGATVEILAPMGGNVSEEVLDS